MTFAGKMVLARLETVDKLNLVKHNSRIVLLPTELSKALEKTNKLRISDCEQTQMKLLPKDASLGYLCSFSGDMAVHMRTVNGMATTGSC